METILKAEWDKFKQEEGVSIYPEEIPSPYKEIAIRAMRQVKNLNIPAVSNSLPDFRDVIESRIKFFNNQYQTYEGSELQNALNIIRRLVPPIQFNIGL
jgi:hypothetical protein